MMHIYVTNLKTSVERRLFMEKQLKKININYEIVDCVVGAELSAEDISSKCDMVSINKLNEKLEWFNKGMIGCTLTNQKVFNDIISRDFPYVLFLEDDTVLPENLPEILDNVETFIKQGDLILLFWNSWNPLFLEKNPIKTQFGFNYYTTKNYKDITCGSAYIVTKEAARKMLAANTPIHVSPDTWGFFYDSGCINRILCAYPHAVQTADFTSTMQIGKFLWTRRIIDKYKIFPFYQYLTYRRKKLKLRSHKVVFE